MKTILQVRIVTTVGAEGPMGRAHTGYFCSAYSVLFDLGSGYMSICLITLD